MIIRPKVAAAEPLCATANCPAGTAALTPPIAVLCDFDGTISTRDTVQALFASFGSQCCRDLNRKWVLGEISSRQNYEGCLGSTSATRDQMECVLSAITIDPFFPAFLRWCSDQSYAFAIVSDGLEWAIRYVLGLYGVHGPTVFATHMQYVTGGYRFDFPWYHPDLPLRGISKPHIIRRYQAQGYRVVYVGDGLTDLEALGVADVVFAKGKLLSLARERSKQVLAFDDLRQVTAQWGQVGQLLAAASSSE